MAVCDSDYRFRIIDVGAYGKDSDGGVLSSSKFYQEIENGRCKLPPEEPLPDSNIVAPYVFLGDEAFALTNFLLRPYPQRQLPDKRRQNITIVKTICLLHNILIDRDGSASHCPELQMRSLQNSRASNPSRGSNKHQRTVHYLFR
nr:unnamed protein product [Callosobruchus analis]